MDLIIGAGVSGISYANFTRDDFLIVERDATPGGYCRTTKRNGYVWDYSGHFFHFRHPYIERYVCQNIAPESLVNAEKHTQILYNRRYVDFPFQKNIHQLDKEEFIVVYMTCLLHRKKLRARLRRWFMRIWENRSPKNF